MNEALRARDLAELARLCHWLKGAGGSMGFDELYEPSRLLEEALERQDAASMERLMEELDSLGERIRRGAQRRTHGEATT